MSDVLKTTSSFRLWWEQFPPELRLITKARLLASIGAGGVLYLTPIVFNSLSLSATQIGSGISLAAIAGTLTRLITGRTQVPGLRVLIENDPIAWIFATDSF